MLLKYHDIYFTWAPAVGYACNYMYIHDVPQLSEYLDDYKNAKDNYSKNCKIPLINDIQYNHLSDHDEANIAIVENIPSFYYLKPVYLVENGKNNEAEQVMIKGESLDREMFSPGTIEYNRAIYHSALKDNDQAMFYLQKSSRSWKAK